MRKRLLMLCVLPQLPLGACDAHEATEPAPGTNASEQGGPGLSAARVIYVKQGQSADSAIRAVQAADFAATQPSSDTAGAP